MFRDVMPGRFHVRVPDIAPAWSVQSVTVAGREVLDAGFIVTDADITGMVVTYTDQPALDRQAQYRGRNRTILTPPCSCFRRTARSGWTRVWQHARSARCGCAKAGTFALTNVIPREYLVVAAADVVAGDWPDERFLLNRLAASATTVRVAAGERPTLTLTTADIR